MKQRRRRGLLGPIKGPKRKTRLVPPTYRWSYVDTWGHDGQRTDAEVEAAVEGREAGGRRVMRQGGELA